jgi:large subunit ribosomal protein L5
MTLQENYKSIKKQLQDELKIKNPMDVPRILKVTINVGTKEAVADKKVLEKIVEQIGLIAGQKPVVTHAKKDISSFKLRRGMPIGVMVTLRGKQMWSFLEKLIAIVFPKVRDFRGVSKTSFDGNGNYSFGFHEQIVFPEIEYGSIDKIRGTQATINTSAKSDKNAIKLLELLGFPFKK